jgi:hypothetical protein
MNNCAVKVMDYYGGENICVLGFFIRRSARLTFYPLQPLLNPLSRSAGYLHHLDLIIKPFYRLPISLRVKIRVGQQVDLIHQYHIGDREHK